MGGGDTAEVGHVLDGAHGEAAVDEAVVHEHVRHPEQRDPQALQTRRNARPRQARLPCVSDRWIGIRDRVKILLSFSFLFFV